VSEPIFLQLGEPTLAGVQWERRRLSVTGSAAVPTGGDWMCDASDDVKCHSPSLGITVIVQQQADVDVSGRPDYFQSFIGVNMRDAPGYRVIYQCLGWVGGIKAARVDAEFTSGTRYATRDYVLFAGDAATMVMARGPFERANDVVLLVDQVAASYRP
jgi:hypothetical protein